MGIVARLQQQRLLRTVHQQASHARQDRRNRLGVFRDALRLGDLDQAVVEPLQTAFRRDLRCLVSLERVQHKFGDALLVRHALHVYGADAQ